MDTNITSKPRARPLRNGAWICYGSGRTSGAMSLNDAYFRWLHRIGPSVTFYVQAFGRAQRPGEVPVSSKAVHLDHAGPNVPTRSIL
ncbi:MAG: hypothetical protein YHS30scaffold667_58 [Phage 65_10]|nr:MAG: hypothetical protein YHS30scaffold667_58 [Phage 65_10]